MKKIIALVLTVLLISVFSVTIYAAGFGPNFSERINNRITSLL